MRIALNLQPKVRISLTLGPKPGTPEFEAEQRAKAEGRQFDYERHGVSLVHDDDDAEADTQRSPDLEPPPPAPPPED